jgi:hypothetical protein
MNIKNWFTDLLTSFRQLFCRHKDCTKVMVDGIIRTDDIKDRKTYSLFRCKKCGKRWSDPKDGSGPSLLRIPKVFEAFGLTSGKKQGYITLIELMIIIAIVAILSALVFPCITRFKTQTPAEPVYTIEQAEPVSPPSPPRFSETQRWLSDGVWLIIVHDGQTGIDSYLYRYGGIGRTGSSVTMLYKTNARGEYIP